MVLQDTWLFNGTVMENIVYNRENISKAEVVEVCKEVGLNHFIRTLPKGYDTVLSDNDSVSAGQRQLLTIARGMIQKHHSLFWMRQQVMSIQELRNLCRRQWISLRKVELHL